jgi:uncharacterized protein YegL
MPRMMADEGMESQTFGQGVQAFNFSATRIEHLGATEYTLATIAVDVTGSVGGFEKELRDCLVAAVESCKKSPRSANLLLRVIIFSDSLGIEEMHGFKPLSEIDPQAYPELKPYGSTNLYDAAYSGVGATLAYAEQLMQQDFLCNGIVFVITDGDDNRSRCSASAVRDEIDKGLRSEKIESIVTVLIGVNSHQYNPELKKFQQAAKIDKFIDAGDATPAKLAKLAEFVSQSVSSQSQSLGTGGPSQNIAATI